MTAGPLQRTFLAAAHAGADVQDPGAFQRLQPALRVGKVGIAAVDQQVAPTADAA